MQSLSASLLCELRAELGEGAQLFPDGTVRLVDIPNGKVFRLEDNNPVLERKLHHEVSKSLPWEEGQIILGRNFIHFYDKQGNEGSSLQVSPESSNLRCSDGCVLPDGSLLVGIVDRDLAQGAGSLLHISPELEITKVLSGATIPNGIAVMPSGNEVVWVDSPTQTLMMLPISQAGDIGRPESYFVIEESLGVPDGLSVDSEGGIWVAMWGGSKVIRVSPDRKVDVQVEVGTKNITSCAFDSANNLLITTATAALSEEELGVRGAGGIWILEQAKHGFQGLKPWVFGVRHN